MNLAPLPIQKFFSNNGRPLEGGKLFTYVSGTSTKIATYKDAAGTLNTNPIILDFRGECRLWIDPTLSYTFVLAPANDTDPPGNPFWTVNDITAGPAQQDNSGDDTGSVNNIELSIPQISSPVAFTRIVFKAANTNTGPVTISINGGTTKDLKWQNVAAFTGGEIQANGIYQAIYDGAQWQLQGPTLGPGEMRTAGEVSASITPSNFAYDTSDYSNLLRYMTVAQRNSIAAGGSVDTQSGWAAAMTMALKAAGSYTADANNGLTILVPAGNYRVNSTIAIPRFVKMISAGTRRGAFTPPTGRGACIQAGFAGPVFSAVESSLQTYDVLIEGLNISGNKATYGAGHGILLTKANGVTLRHLVVSDFGSDNIRLDGAGAYGLECIEVYSATAGNANFYIDGQYCTLSICRSDGGVYSVYNTASNGDGLEISSCHFEGPTTRCLHILGGRFKMMGGILIPTITATGGAYLNGSNPALIGTEIFHQNGGTSYGVESDTGASQYRYAGLTISGFSTCMILREGIGAVSGCNINGNTTGLELVGGSYVGEISGNHIGGVTNSILHTSGNGKWKLGPNRLCDAANPQTFKAMTVTAGFPLSVTDSWDTTPPTVASASSVTLPWDTDLIYISGTTNITSIGASGHSGKVKRLYFLGALTVVDGSNLVLAGGANFVTTADDILTLTCDGTNWIECSRSAN